VDELTTAAGIAALAAGALALLALAGLLLLRRRLRELRAAQRVVLGGEERDLVGHAEEVDRRLGELGQELRDSVARLDERGAALSDRLDGAVTHFAVVRYDAMGEMTGRQSSSVALLDASRSGVVLSSILHREQARLYAKQVVDGRSEFDLSPEEQEALSAALASRRSDT
jgi:hypothetical protein